MPTYLVTAPDGRKLRLTGDSPPNKQALDDIFDKVGKKTAAPDSSPLDSPAAIPPADFSKLDLNKIAQEDAASKAYEAGQNSSDFLAATTDPQTGILARGQKPFIAIPSATIKPDDSKLVAVGKEAYNLAKSIPEFIESPLGIATLPVAGEAKAGKLIAGAFGVNSLKNVGQGIVESHKNWDNYTPAQKAVAVTDIVGNGAFATLLGRGALGKTPASEPLAGAHGASDIGNTVAGKVLPSDAAAVDLNNPDKPQLLQQLKALQNPTTEQIAVRDDLQKKSDAANGKAAFAKAQADADALKQSTANQAGAKNVPETVGVENPPTVPAQSAAPPNPPVATGQTPKDLARQKVADWWRNNANAIRSKDEYASHVTEANKDEILANSLKFADEIASGKQDGNFTVAQRIHHEMTGESVPLLSKPPQESARPTEPKYISPEELMARQPKASPSETVSEIEARNQAYKNRPVKETGEELNRQWHEQQKVRPTEQGKPLEQAKASDVESFLDSQKLNPMQRGKAKSVLDAQAGRRSGGKIYQGKRSDVINEMLADGYVPKSREVKAVKDLTGTQSNRMDNREQADFAKRQAAAGTKTEYTLEKGDGDSIFTVTKQEHDFAKYLQDSKPKEQPPAEHIGEPEKVQSPEQILESNDSVKVKMPKGATMLRVSTESNGKKFKPVEISKSELEKGNVFKGAGVTKIEAGTMSGKDFVPMKGEVSVEPKIDPRFKGLGAELYGGQKYPPLSQLTDSMSVLAKQSPKTDSAGTAFDFGKSVSEMKDRASEAINGLRAVGQYLKTKAEGYPVWTSFKAALGDRHLALTESVKNAEEFVKESQKTIPDKLTQEAISDYIDAGGNVDLLKKAEAETKDAYKQGYEKAQNLSPEEKALAENARSYFSQRLQDAIDNGILEDGIEDYIHRIYPAESPLKSAILSELRSGIFTGRPALAKQRVYEYDYEAEKAGLKPVKSFIKRIAAYDLSLNKAIADRQIVKAMTQIKMADGRPMVDVGGIGTKIEGTPEKAGAVMIRPSAKTSKPDDKVNDRGDYKSKDFPALKKWKWVSKDGDGNQIFVQGDVLIHPDAVKQVDRLFKRSAIRENPIGRAALAVGSTIKQTMLDISGFHPVQITVHGWEHRTFKPVGKIDFDNPDVRGLVRGGLVVGETTGHELFSEGLSGGGSSLTRHIPIIGEKLQAYNHWLFNDYIPKLKVATGLHALERNRAKFPNLPKDELYHLTANQMNNAFGELNYEMIGRSRTMQDVMRLALLAPDFLEARAGFAGQALTKYGSEQRTALLLGAATLYVTARILNKLLDGEYHFEPKNAFSVIYNKKAYSLRTVQGDLLKAAFEPGQFIYSRLNPVYGRTLMEFFSGRDYFGRQRSGLQQLKDFATTVVPISLKGLVNPREQSIYESFLNAFGVTNRRSTSSSDIFQLADNFKKEHKIATEPGDFVYDSDKDPYYGIKEAAIFSNTETTANEIKKAINSGHDPKEIWKHFSGYASRPFTGSKANDAQFYSELSGDNKKIYDDAVKERKLTDSKFKAAWELAGLPPEGGGSAGALSPLSPLSR